MSAIIILTPVIISSWPAITAAVAAAASAMGMAVSESVKAAAKEEQQVTEKTVEVELQQSEVVSKNLSADKEIVVTKGDVELRVKRDETGRCVVCAKAKGHNEAELKMIAKDFGEKLTQCYIYDKVMRELKSKNFQVVNEEVSEDQSIRINVRRWVD
jgi:ABC-type transporter MlaC component